MGEPLCNDHAISKGHIWAFGDCVVIAGCLRMLKMPFLGLWRLRGHCTVAQNAISGLLEIVRSLRGGSKSHIWAFGDCAVIVQRLRMSFLAFWRLHSVTFYFYIEFF